VHDIPDVVPLKKLYAVRVRCETPIVVQPTRAEYEPWNPITHAMASFVAYPGPVGKKETRWIYADGLTLSSANPLEVRIPSRRQSAKEAGHAHRHPRHFRTARTI
jgi:hypothetical protein